MEQRVYILFAISGGSGTSFFQPGLKNFRRRGVIRGSVAGHSFSVFASVVLQISMA
jgi:hypothetical protein